MGFSFSMCKLFLSVGRNKCLYIISATIEENKTDIKEDKQYTSNKNKSKDVCSMPNQKFNSNSDCRFLESTENCGDMDIK